MLKPVMKYCIAVPLWIGLAAMAWAEKYADTWQDESLHSMSNEELQAAAKVKRNNEMSHTHQALNYQWMALHANESGPKRSNKALKKMFKQHFKHYWREHGGKQKRHKLSRTDKSSQTNYGLKMSGDTVKLAFEHRFF